MSPLIFFLIAIFFVNVYDVYAEPDEYVFAGGEKGIRFVPVYYVDTIYCNGFNLDDKGCYDVMNDYITIKIGYRDVWTPRGCTILQHEQTHAWGFYDEVSVSSIFKCDNPVDKSETQGLYDEDNIFHFNPRYEWKGYGITHDPSCTTWYVGELPERCGR